jgi:hypothetical protein
LFQIWFYILKKSDGPKDASLTWAVHLCVKLDLALCLSLCINVGRWTVPGISNHSAARSIIAFFGGRHRNIDELEQLESATSHPCRV